MTAIVKPTARRRLAPPDPPAEPSGFPCAFCKTVFRTERRLVAHLCERKRRFLARDDRAVRLGLLAFQRFYQRSMGARTPPTHDAFANSQFYTAFVRFGHYLGDLNAFNPYGFIDFLLRTETPIDRWQTPSLYEMFIRELIKTETPIEAVRRNLLLMEQWAMEAGQPWQSFFAGVAPALATLWIKSGRLSPWVLLVAPTADKLFCRLSVEQTQLVEAAIDPAFWQRQIEQHASEVESIRAILADAGV